MIEMASLMTSLSKLRPLFHSERDLQLALAWHIREIDPDAQVRLEYKPFPQEAIYLDIWVQVNGRTLALELKYVTRKIDVVINGENYGLKNQSAQDTRRYDFVRDLVRLERIVEEYPDTCAYAILLTNDSALWKPAHSNNTADSAFRLHNGVSLKGILQWAEHTGQGTMTKRESPHTLKGTYQPAWQDYSLLPHAHSYNQFRYLLVCVGVEPTILQK